MNVRRLIAFAIVCAAGAAGAAWFFAVGTREPVAPVGTGRVKLKLEPAGESRFDDNGNPCGVAPYRRCPKARVIIKVTPSEQTH